MIRRTSIGCLGVQGFSRTSDFGGNVAAGRQRERRRRIARRDGHDVEHDGFWITISSLIRGRGAARKEAGPPDERPRRYEELRSADGRGCGNVAGRADEGAEESEKHGLRLGISQKIAECATEQIVRADILRRSAFPNPLSFGQSYFRVADTIAPEINSAPSRSASRAINSRGPHHILPRLRRGSAGPQGLARSLEATHREARQKGQPESAKRRTCTTRNASSTHAFDGLCTRGRSTSSATCSGTRRGASARRSSSGASASTRGAITFSHLLFYAASSPPRTPPR